MGNTGRENMENYLEIQIVGVNLLSFISLTWKITWRYKLLGDTNCWS